MAPGKGGAQKAPRASGLLPKLRAAYYAVRNALHFLLLWLNRQLWVHHGWRRSRNKRDILIIGDETAIGFGDWLVCGQEPGYGKYLQQELKGAKDVKFEWSVFSEGHLGARSDDWLPLGPSRPRRLRWLVWKTLFQDAFGPSGLHADCDIVIIHLGAHDEHDDPERTADNIITIGRELVSRGKRVWVCGMPIRSHALDPTNVRHGWLLSERNNAIKSAIKRAGIDHLQFAADPETYRKPELYGWDGQHLSRKGYMRLGKELGSFLHLPCIQIEWKVLEPLVAEKMKERDRVYAEKAEQLCKAMQEREMRDQGGGAADAAADGTAHPRRS
eukprot:TRINITY_DN65592_c0_g1_i1.p1 TRINITY_DN65592_c0_g1~~TRINITY_DN65592_c0_g1_i1.p1  ORF type:complete len:355 (+),score=90.97 TRINITY_DN65592_c0_g1_i1:79-1065(+)